MTPDATSLANIIEGGVVVLRADETVWAWNDWMAKRSGMAESEVLGKALGALFPDMLERPSYRQLARGMERKGPIVLSTALHKYLIPLAPLGTQKQGGVEHMHQVVKGAPFPLPNGESGYILFISDVTERVIQDKRLRETIRELQVKNEQVEQAKLLIEEKARLIEARSEVKSQFLANMSHELRTPLNSILVLSQILKGNRNETLTDKEIEFSRVIHQSGSDLLAIINDILDYAKVEAGAMPIRVDPVEFKELVERVFDVMQPLANNKGIKLSVHWEEHAPVEIVSDGMRIEQVLRNLLSNAIKFTDQGSVELIIGADEDDRVRMLVKDTGIGIPEGDEVKIFEPFQQVESDANRNYEGTGLGLALSREMAQLLGGDISCMSKQGHGSTFTFTFLCNMAGYKD